MQGCNRRPGSSGDEGMFSGGRQPAREELPPYYCTGVLRVQTRKNSMGNRPLGVKPPASAGTPRAGRVCPPCGTRGLTGAVSFASGAPERAGRGFRPDGAMIQRRELSP